MEGFTLKQHRDHDGEDEQGDDLLNHLQLDERKGTTIVNKTNAIGGHLADVFKERNPPGEGDYSNQGPVFTYARFAQLQMAVPSNGHKYIAQYEQKDGVDS